MILGSAVPTTVWSSATKNSESMRPATASNVPRRSDRTVPTLIRRTVFPDMRPSPVLPRSLFHPLGEQAEHPPQFLVLLLTQDFPDATFHPPVEVREPLQPQPAFLGQVHPHHPIVLGVALAAHQTFALQPLADPGDPRRLHLKELADLPLPEPVVPAQDHQHEPFGRTQARLPLDQRHHPFERQSQWRQHRDALPNYLFSSRLDHSGSTAPRLHCPVSIPLLFAAAKFAL